MPKIGYKPTPEHRNNLSVAHKGQMAWNKGTSKSGMLGKRHNKGTIELMSKKAMGRTHTLEARKKMSKSKTGTKFSYDTKKKMSMAQLNVSEEEWDGFKYTENKKFRKTHQYKYWRWEVFLRDIYTCQDCGETSGILNAHHIKSFAKYPKLRLNINNGITLCHKCHMELHRLVKK